MTRNIHQMRQEDIKFIKDQVIKIAIEQKKINERYDRIELSIGQIKRALEIPQ